MNPFNSPEFKSREQAAIASLKEEAKVLGVKVKEHWIDDWKENIVILIVGMILGATLKWIFF